MGVFVGLPMEYAIFYTRHYKILCIFSNFFLAAEYPQLSIRKAMRVSKEITKGHKADIFVTQLSFLGWAILAAIPAGIGFFWLTPYYNMTMTNVYHALLKEAVAKGTIKAEDLAG